MILTIKDLKTGDTIYRCIAEGDPENPSRIEETGSDMQNFKDAAYNKIREQRDYVQAAIYSSPGAYKIANIFQNAIRYLNRDAGEELFSIHIEDLIFPEEEEEDPRDDKFIVDEDDLILTRK